MKQLSLIGLSFFLIFSSGCASKTQREWDARKSIPQFVTEKVKFQQRLGGKVPCWKTGVDQFTRSNESPSNECLYPLNGFFWNPKGPAQNIKQLKVIQATPKGFLVEHTYSQCAYGSGCWPETDPFTIFIHKTDEEEVIDESYLDKKSDDSLYEYTGPFTYESVLGTKTVRSFKKVSRATFVNAYGDLTFYNPYDELLAEIGLWKNLEETLNSPDRVQLHSE